MSKRNFILLIIILIITGGTIFWFLSSRPNTSTPEEDNIGTNFISQFNPFGNNKNPSSATNPLIEIPEYQPDATETANIKLKKVSSMPIAGFTVFSKERLKEVPLIMPETVMPTDSTVPKKTTKPTPPSTEFMPALRYVERATGNIYETFADKIEEKKFSITIIPMVYEALFGNKGNSVVMRYLKSDKKTIITFVGTLPKELLGADIADGNEIKGVFLPEDIKDISLSGDTLSLFYLFNSGNNMIGTTLNLINNKKTQVFDSPFTEWLSSFPNNKMITFTTKPASDIPGYLYAIDPSNKNYNFHKIFGNINGLTTTTSPDGKLILYSNDKLSLSIYNLDTKVSILLGIKTLPEKCVWNKASNAIYCGVPKSITNNRYPDTWYQGEVSFSDQIWKIDIKTESATLLLDPITISGEDIDSIKLMLDSNENYLFFINKKDSFLWEFNLK